MSTQIKSLHDSTNNIDYVLQEQIGNRQKGIYIIYKYRFTKMLTFDNQHLFQTWQ